MNPYRSALTMLPIVFGAMGSPPGCVVDVGAGDCGWLRAALELGSTAALGLDIEPFSHLPPTLSEVLASGGLFYLEMDLRHPEFPGPRSPWRSADLVICLETAEHLHPEFGEGLVDFVTSLVGPTGSVLWSAATPGQGPYGEESDHGAHHNERPSSYWKGLFLDRGFAVDGPVTDALRGPSTAEADPWYRNSAALLRRRPS